MNNTKNIEKIENNNFLYNSESSENTARLIAQSGNFEKIEKELTEKGLFKQEEYRVKKLFKKDIDLSDFPLKQAEIFKLLTIQELYDTGTAVHCIKTYKIAKEKINKVFSDNIILAEIIKNEGVDLERFYFACLTHDIGKIEIPNFIINNTFKKDKWDKILIDMIDNNEITEEILNKLDLKLNNKQDKDKILKQMKEMHIYSKQIVPITKGISEEEKIELEKKWNISVDNSLMDIIDKHAEISEEIIRKKGFPIVAKIVGQHHHKKNIEDYPVATNSLQISTNIIDILHFLDVKEALESNRAYKKGFKEIQVMNILINHANEKKIGKEIVYLLIKDDFKKLKKKNISKNSDPEEKNMEKYVENFINKFNDKDYKNDFNNWSKKYNNNSKIKICQKK